MKLSRGEISEAVGALGWRFVLGALTTSVRVGGLAEATEVAVRAVIAVGGAADDHLSIDLRRRRVVFTLRSRATAWVGPVDIESATRISAAVQDLGLATEPGADRSVQGLEVAIDAMNIAAIRPFWRAVLGYVDETGAAGPEDPLVDPLGEGPAIWFQQMDAPRRQRNRIHLDVTVPHDEAPSRLRAVLAAGGSLVSDARAPAFWVLADPEANEACITTWQGRD